MQQQKWAINSSHVDRQKIIVNFYFNAANLSFQELKEIKITILKVIFIKYEYRDRPAAPLITEDNLNIVSESMFI